MRESFQNIILHLVLTGIFFLCVAELWVLTRRLFRQFRALGKLTRVLVVVMVTVAALLAQKPDDEGDEDNDGNGDEGESGNYSLAENTIHAYEPWTLRGAADDWFILNFTNNWVFPHDSNHWTRCVVLTSGQVWDTTRGTNRLVAVGQQMSAVPDESCFTYELTDENSYLLTWSNFFLNRDTNQPITASIELKRNGDWIATSNEVSVSHEMTWPHGATNTLPNTAEIESINDGQFLLHAVFPEDVEERIALTITTGTNLWRYCVGAGGEYAFPLDKGREYEISVSWNQGSAAPVWPSPDCDGVGFSCSDGMENPEVYFIKGNDKPDGNGIRARGKCSPYGIIVKKATGYLTLAHEIGHACGWDDIYVPEDDEDLEDLPAFAENLPNDWGCYQLGTLQSDLVKRLLMFGMGTPSRGDIPSGPVYGVRRVASGSSFFRTELVPVGLNVMQIQMSR